MTKRNAIRKRVRKLVQHPIQRPPALLRPGKHFAGLERQDGEHPVDLAVRSIPAVARRDRRLRRMSGDLARQLQDRKMFIEYEDLRLCQLLERQEAHFDWGFEYGRLTGRAESAAARVTASPAARAFSGKLLAAVTGSGLSRQGATAVLLELARGIVLGTRLPDVGAGRTRKRRPIGHA